MKLMKGSKRVSWAPGIKLCQVKMFISEDPIRVGVQAQDKFEAKPSRMLCSKSVDSHGHSSEFQGRHHANTLKGNLSCIPQIKWKCPPKFGLDCNWLVAAGEESQEVEAQKHRESRVLEAVYPYISAIPLSPSVSLDVEHCGQDHDRRTPIVPITPIEESSTADMASDMVEPLHASFNPPALVLPQGVSMPGHLKTPQRNPPLNPSANGKPELEMPPGFGHLNTPQCNPPLNPSAYEKPALETPPGFEADVVTAAAAAALTAILKSNEQGSMIDTDLLIKILSDPKMVAKLINENKAPANIANAPTSGPKPVTPMLCSLKPDVINKYANKCDAIANPGIAPTTQLKLVTPLVPFPSARPSVEMTNEYRGPENTGTEPMSKPMHSTQFCPKPDMGVFPKLNPVQNMVQPGLPVKPCRIDAVHTSSISAVPVFPKSNQVQNMVQPGLPVKPCRIDAVQTSSISAVPVFPKSNQVQNMVQPGLPVKPCRIDAVQTSSISAVPVFPKSNQVQNMVQPGLPVKPCRIVAVQTSSISAVPLPPAKDVNYYKNLIKLHGERPQNQYYNIGSQFGTLCNDLGGTNLVASIESKLKYQKPCIYFKSSKGCRKGSLCQYTHHMQNKLRYDSELGAPNAKRMKLGGEITGRT